MNKDKIIDKCNEIIELLSNNDLTYAEALMILDILKSHILKKIRGE